NFAGVDLPAIEPAPVQSTLVDVVDIQTQNDALGQQIQLLQPQQSLQGIEPVQFNGNIQQFDQVRQDFTDGLAILAGLNDGGKLHFANVADLGGFDDAAGRIEAGMPPAQFMQLTLDSQQIGKLAATHIPQRLTRSLHL